VEAGVDPKMIFRALYLAFLGRERGPRLGWFLEALSRDFVIRRMLEAVNAGVE
jgi:lysyl-tRNA synthetase class 1